MNEKEFLQIMDGSLTVEKRKAEERSGKPMMESNPLLERETESQNAEAQDADAVTETE